MSEDITWEKLDPIKVTQRSLTALTHNFNKVLFSQALVLTKTKDKRDALSKILM